MIDFDDIGIKISLRRRELGLSQSDLAGRAGVVRQTIARIEAGGGGSVAAGTLLGVLNAVSYDLVLELGLPPRRKGAEAFDLDRYLDDRYYGGIDD